MPLKELHQLQWKTRVILLTVVEKKLAATKRKLDEHDDGIVERDIAWFVFTGRQIHTNLPMKITPALTDDIIAYFSDGIKVVLIGKDGGVKLRSEILEMTKIFDLIDSMPMRIREMRQK